MHSSDKVPWAGIQKSFLRWECGRFDSLIFLVTEDMEIAQPGHARWPLYFPESENCETDYGFSSVLLPQPPKEGKVVM